MTAFSVVICTHNRADRIGRAITTVLSQTFDDFEVVMVDDGSVDDTCDIVTAIDDARLQYVYQDCGGLSAARNTGVANRPSRYVTFLDDDEALSAWLERFDDETLADCHARAGVAAARLGRYGEARHHLRRAVAARPRRVKQWLRLGVAFVPPLGDAVWRAHWYHHLASKVEKSGHPS